MPYYETSQEWLRQSALLLEARPSTTRITTTYHLTDKTGSSKKRQKRRQQQLQTATTTTTTTTTASSAAPRASLTIKTYDPHSGTCLKYRTTKAAEVSRLILSLGQLGRRMAALPTDTDAVMVDAGVAEEVGTPGVEKTEGSGSAGGNAGAKGQTQTQPPAQTQGQGQTGGVGGKGKKKRGKK
ncbi:signal recognition particle 9 kDa protein-domain-containing protein [Xylaria grammica]|nr:signal recognition particle 9 kDa protein-domain-containing protein [Xylaria grammica]